jgi:integrase
MDALMAHRVRQDEERETAGELWHDGGWVFAQPNGKPTDPRADYEDWRTLLRDAGVRPARLHDARHTAATMLLVLKVPTRAVMDVMGWSHASMTGRYQHVPAEVLTSIAEEVGGLLWKTDEAGPQTSNETGNETTGPADA